MKRFFLLFALFVLFAGVVSNSSVQAQTLYFCEDVDEDGYPENEATTFTIGENGGWLKFLVRMDEEVDCDLIKYVIYKVGRSGKEKYDTTIEQDVESNWAWFWKKVTFYDDGTYNVYVYDEHDKFITSSTLKINFRD